ncbi:type II toxin-antitoxin system PemK/MazF family toxin [Rubinisphaera margarita]|uniref:type II toxin-antitoxin system PemK/MazF family toxin n=1 Tax=Rubinisphaera margarita TaxID=2909586 RepID=UPI001EE81378|nr:type II toxin-antitoxin system PemK/MazF family toxin [Rubinisphaera margarita]MCG6155000.1 type II toxin-antitoxin system PemK/MazF family toxin [Rubinisphaera margarita]
MNQGDVYMVRTSAGARPAVIVSREELNRGNYLLAVFCTSTKFTLRSQLPNCVPFLKGEFGFTKDCVAQAETISLVVKNDLDGQIGALPPERVRDLIRAIGNVIDADCEQL